MATRRYPVKAAIHQRISVLDGNIPLNAGVDTLSPVDHLGHSDIGGDARQRAGEPVIVVRNREGVLKAMSSVCQHRAMLVAEGSGNRRSFVCPYHQSTYSLDGVLIGAPAMDRSVGFDKSDDALPNFKVEKGPPAVTASTAPWVNSTGRRNTCRRMLGWQVDVDRIVHCGVSWGRRDDQGWLDVRIDVGSGCRLRRGSRVRMRRLV